MKGKREIEELQPVYVYNEQRALEVLEFEGDIVELHCVKNQMRICKSKDDVIAFYKNGQPNDEVEPE